MQYTVLTDSRNVKLAEFIKDTFNAISEDNMEFVFESELELITIFGELDVQLSRIVKAGDSVKQKFVIYQNGGNNFGARQRPGHNPVSRFRFHQNCNQELGDVTPRDFTVLKKLFN